MTASGRSREVVIVGGVFAGPGCAQKPADHDISVGQLAPMAWLGVEQHAGRSPSDRYHQSR